MKVNRYLVVTVLVLVLALLMAGNSALAGKRPPLRQASSIQADVIPSWALLPSAPSPVGWGDAGSGPIEPELLRALQKAESGDVLRVVVHLHEQADVEAAVGGALSATEARFRVVSALQASAARSQAPLLAYLEGARAAGLVESYTPFWIFNGIAVRARPSVIRAIAAHPAVAAVRLDRWRQWVPDSRLQIADSNSQSRISNLESGVEWNIARIHADQVWSALHVSGTGSLVAGMDTGVDWLHPALQASYRGYNPHGPANHTYSWYDATDGGALYPVDGHGHGSHTLGTAVGQDGIGVAPGARWIAVRVLNNEGYGYDSWIHAGFQWLVAPGGDPARAPDVVNCSWGHPNGSLTTFQTDLRALRAAGVLAVFSNGNDGPGRGTVGSPASLPGAFAVGAADPDDEVADFSSRGPSPWGEIRPHVAAPGVSVRSSLPGGAFGQMNGTSMAAPHVSGIVALLRSVSPTLSITRAAFLISSTAVSLGAPVPNNDSGWGRVDAFAAVAALARPGFITGTVARAGDGVPIAGATVVAAPRRGEGGGRATTNENGSYRLALAPTTYSVTASAFGYETAAVSGVVVTTDTTTVVHFSLSPLPTGVLQGRVTDAATGRPLTATVSVVDTPLETSADTYSFALPAGTYVLRARRLGYRVVTATVAVTPGHVTVANLALPPAPSILLVDSGPWYYGSHASYFRQALDDLAYAYEERAIKHIPGDVPKATDLVPYDVVVWSAPEDAPGIIGAQEAITGYLSAGGQMLLTGQDVGFWDGGGSFFDWSPYYREYLKARYVGDDAPTRVLEGTPGELFAGLTITIAGAGGADNQDYPDVIGVADPDAAAPVLAYQGDGCGGIRVGTCLDYRVIYLSFGFEAINDRAVRREVMGRALDWLSSPPPAVGLELKLAAQMHIGLPGSAVTHTLRLRHVGQRGVTDTVDVALDGASWATRLSAPSLSLAPCASTTVVVSVTIPPTAGWNARDVAILAARSALSPTLTETAVLTTKVAAPILLVDDDRWYDQEDKYGAALTSGDLPYDYWRTGLVYGEPGGGSPPSNVLRRYPIVVWFTSYDWYAPVTVGEEATLRAYLDGGGRLFLSSQDFLYYHYDDPLSRDYLGVMTYTEDVTPTLAWGVPEDPVGDRLGPYPLDYPFRNWSDAVVPAPGTAVPFRDQERRPIALARQVGDRRTVLFSFPFETLPEAGRAEVMERAVGWLSWLGGSTFTAGRSAVSGGDTVTYTIVLRNDGPDVVSASLSNTLPLSLTLVPDNLTGPASYHVPTRRFAWEGSLRPGAAVTVTYRVTVAEGSPVGAPAIINVARLGLEGQGIHFRRSAVVRVGAPDLSPSAFHCGLPPDRPGAVVTCTLGLANAGTGDAPGALVTNPLPADAALVPGSLAWVGGGAAEALTGTVRWAGPLSGGARVTLTYELTLPTNPVHPPLYSVAFLEDGVGWAWERQAWLLLEPRRSYLPVVMRKG
jgi:uncharacterized repeat protein (TIGR01451 family)